MRHALVSALVAALIAFLGACDQLKPKYSGIDLTGADWGRDFRLPDADGRERSLAEFRGKYVMVFFGFIYCPEVCPTVLYSAAQARKALGADGERIQVIAITLDPERDTPAQMKEYAAAFDPTFIGLRGDLDRTKAVAKEFRVFFQKVPAGNTYTIDHTAFTYVFDPEGRLRLALRHQQTTEEIVADLRTLMRSAP
ncbi:MAG: SCO family protein [Betaproteobacteria bacterium]|nr:SCO family protein [Betaproteobacteria bacterium]